MTVLGAPSVRLAAGHIGNPGGGEGFQHRAGRGRKRGKRSLQGGAGPASGLGALDETAR
jgi:hypothetical protein